MLYIKISDFLCSGSIKKCSKYNIMVEDKSQNSQPIQDEIK